MLSLPPRRSGPPRQPVCDGPYCLHLHGCRLGLRGYHFRGHLCVRLRYGLETRPHPADEAVERLQKVGFPSPCSPSYRALALPLVGLPPTEHASLRWTHNRACHFRIIRLSSSLGAVGTGSLHLADPYPRLPGKPAALRPGVLSPVDGFPVRRLLRQLRAPRARTP
jgi:hypothetical protein